MKFSDLLSSKAVKVLSSASSKKRLMHDIADVAEAAVVGFPHDVKGTGIAAFVITHGQAPAPGSDAAEAMKKAMSAHVAKELGPISKPDQIRFAPGLPKTRSGKILRRLLRAVAAGEAIQQDTTTLEDPTILDELRGGSAS